MNCSIRDDVGFQHALLNYTDELMVTAGTEEGTDAHQAQEVAEMSAYGALCAVIDARTARYTARAARTGTAEDLDLARLTVVIG